VLDMVKAMETASGREIKYVIAPRRPGDLDTVYSDPSKVINAYLRLMTPREPH
jgi:UDP-glucose 4-epimerase